MAEQGGDIGARLFASGQIGGGAKGAADDSVNSKDALQAMAEGSDKAVYNMAKIVGLPVNLSGIGSTSAMVQFESEGVANKNIPSMFQSLSTQGSWLVKLMHDIFVKNREITDHTTGVGGNASGDGGGAGAGGGGDFTGNSGGGMSMLDGSMGGGGDMVAVTVSALPTGASRFDWGEASQPIGGFTPSSTPSMGVSSGAGMEIG